MARLIDADELMERMIKDPLFPLVERYGVSGVISQAPTIDAVSVVRCKDCTYWEQAKPDSGSCNRAFEITAYANDFCSYGERKNDTLTYTINAGEV